MMNKSFEKYNFQFHYESTFEDGEHNYAYYLPAYRFGVDIAESTDYMILIWDSAADSIRKQWEEEHTTPWEEIEEAVEFGWRVVKDQHEAEIRRIDDPSKYR